MDMNLFCLHLPWHILRKRWGGSRETHKILPACSCFLSTTKMLSIPDHMDPNIRYRMSFDAILPQHPSCAWFCLWSLKVKSHFTSYSGFFGKIYILQLADPHHTTFLWFISSLPLETSLHNIPIPWLLQLLFSALALFAGFTPAS